MYTYEFNTTEVLMSLAVITAMFGVIAVATYFFFKHGALVKIAAALTAVGVVGVGVGVALPAINNQVEKRNIEDIQAWAHDEYNLDLPEETVLRILKGTESGAPEAMLNGDIAFYPYWKDSRLELRDVATHGTLEPASSSNGIHDHDHEH